MSVGELSLRVPASCRPGDQHKTQRELTEIVEEYVEGVFRLREAMGKVTTGELAEYMQVSAGSATSMVKKLCAMGLASRKKYRAIELTAAGEALAKQLSRSHRILKRFLVDALGLPWNDVHELACKLEHYVSVDVIERMYDRIGRPARCPHGTPIDLDVHDECVRLSDVDAGAKCTVLKITNERFEFLAYLEEIGLLPDVEFLVESISPVDELLRLRIGAKEVTVGREVTLHIWVQIA
jgi:DtxR family Mn-dependent transcriptional regulator